MFNIVTIKAVLKDLWHFSFHGNSLPDDIERPASFNDSFIRNKRYTAKDLDTQRIRLELTKLYAIETIDRPLQASEYVAYTLQKDGADLPMESAQWSPGSWHTRLRGNNGVHISVVPMSGAVMEFRDDSGRAVIGRVLSVSDAEEILFGTINVDPAGQYDEYLLKAIDWHELRPVFINFKSYEK